MSRRRVLSIAVALAAVVVIGAVAYNAPSRDGKPSRADASGDEVHPVDLGRVVTARVERRRLVGDVMVSGTVRLGVTRRRAFDCDPSNDAVLTTVADGSAALTFGSVVATIQGEPVLVLPGRFPWYRDLRLGDTGPDVRQLNLALLGRDGSTVSEATLRAFARAARNGRSPKVIRQCALIAVPSSARRLAAHGQVGEPARKLTVTYSVGGASLRARIPGEAVDRVARGTRFVAPGVRGTVGELHRGDGTVDAVIQLTSLPARRPRQLTGRLVLGRGEVQALVLPASAIYESPQARSYVMKVVRDAGVQRVDVRPLAHDAGLVSVRPSSPAGLRTGDRVLVGPYTS